MGLIEGTTTAKEVFANFLKSIGQILVQEGTKMIAMYIAIAIAKAIAGMGSNFTGGTSSAVPTDAAGWGSSFNTELPGITSVGKIGFAKGGAFTNSVVSSPTMFKFADGGTTRTGLMGEAGPEAIMPLKRGADGSLGVQANGLREAMGRPPGGGSGSPVLNMSFQSTSINGVEYVSREQLESAMAETRRNATRDGAKRGMTMTLDRIQNSSSTRRKVGI
jgi:phage-related minor tail protein